MVFPFWVGKETKKSSKLQEDNPELSKYLSG